MNGIHYPVIDGHKVCNRCGENKPVSAFNAPNGKVGARCKKCRYEVSRLDRGIPQSVWKPKFWAWVDKTDECWVWKGAPKVNDGYGVFWINGMNLRAHRIAWELDGRTLPEWPMVLDHICRNRLCVRPDHLRVVHQRINTLENNDSAFAKNAAKTSCKHGHDITSPGNTALVVGKAPKGTQTLCRMCLTCYPSYWNSPHRIFITA